MSAPRLTAAQINVLRYASEGEVRPAARYEVHANFDGSPTWYGVPRKAFDKCMSLGLLADGRLTDAGRQALAAYKETPDAD